MSNFVLGKFTKKCVRSGKTESQTQTSKTILQLAKLDLQKLDGRSLKKLYPYTVTDLKTEKCGDPPSREIKQNIKPDNDHLKVETGENFVLLTFKDIMDKSVSVMRTLTQEDLVSCQDIQKHIPLKWLPKSVELEELSICIDGEKQVIFSNKNNKEVKKVPHIPKFLIKEIKVKPTRPKTKVEKVTEKEVNNERGVKSCCTETQLLKTTKPVDSVVNEEKYDPYKTKSESDISTTTSSRETMNRIYNNIRSDDWNTALKGIKELLSCTMYDYETVFANMPMINQRIIELLRCPRSHVCRISCQHAGRLFELFRDTRRPEFDDIVELLLNRTADANKFIRKNANDALDAMASSIPPFHAVRAVCLKGPFHKNDLVRTAVGRVLVSIVLICGNDLILGHGANEYTRKRILNHMKKLLTDKCSSARQFAEKLHSILRQHPNFEYYVRKTFDKSESMNIKTLFHITL